MVFGGCWGRVRACRSRRKLGGVGEHPHRPPPQANPLLQRLFPDHIIQDRKYSVSEPPLGRGRGRRWSGGGGGSRRKKREIRPRETARRGCGAEQFCHLAIAGARARPRPRPGEARGESRPPPRPRPPAAAESPGPAGAGRGGVWRSAGGGGLGARRGGW